jgi:hypothetical protein
MSMRAMMFALALLLPLGSGLHASPPAPVADSGPETAVGNESESTTPRPPRETLKDKIRRLSPLNASIDTSSDAGNATRHEAPSRSVMAALTAPIARAWTALIAGDWSALAKAILTSWLIFALIAVAIGILLARRCSARKLS